MSKVLKRSRYVLTLLVILLITACGSSKKASTDTTGTEVAKTSSGDNDRLIVSFFSPGNGIDHKMKKKYTDFIRASYPNIDYTSNQWGKEGETTLCFSLSELTEKEKVEFIKKSKEVLAASSRVHVYENAPCGNKTAK